MLPSFPDIRRILIIAKTYPELSSKYGETVCTAGIDEVGRPLRLYPIPFRYLGGPQRFRRYQWITAALDRSPRDSRLESYAIRHQTIALGEQVKATTDEWGRRAEIVLKSGDWQFDSMRSLLRSQHEIGRSLAFIRPRAVGAVTIAKRDPRDAGTFDEKLKRLRVRNAAARSQLDLFEQTIPDRMKTLEYVNERVCVDWFCWDSDCGGHSMQVLDWEICELARRKGTEAARIKVQLLLDETRYRSALILGNFHMFPGSFAIIGLWYPKRSERLF